jgi:hypothetical protein
MRTLSGVCLQLSIKVSVGGMVRAIRRGAGSPSVCSAPPNDVEPNTVSVTLDDPALDRGG